MLVVDRKWQSFLKIALDLPIKMSINASGTT